MPRRRSAAPPAELTLGAVDLAIRREVGRPLPACAQIDFEGAPVSLERLRAHVAERIADIDVLHYGVAPDGRTARRLGRPSVADHVRVFDLPLDKDGTETGRRMLSEPLPSGETQPSWDLWLVRRGAYGYTLCYRADHTLQDGALCIYVVRALLDDEPTHLLTPHRAQPLGPRGIAEVLKATVTAFRSPPVGPAFAVRPAGVCDLAHVDTPLADLRAIGRARGVSVNDVYLAALALAVHRWHHESTGTSHPPLPVSVPLSVRGPGDQAEPLNAVVSARITLPCDRDDPARALKQVRAQTERLRETRQRDAAALLLGALPPVLGARLARLLLDTRAVTTVTSNVNFGPALVHQGRTAVRATGLVNLAGGVVCGTLLVGYADNARLTVVFDRALTTAHRLCDHWLGALRDLAALPPDPVHPRDGAVS